MTHDELRERLVNTPILHTKRTVIRLLREHEAPLLQRYRVDNREHLAPWEPLREESHYGLGPCARAIVDGLAAAADDRAWPMVALNAGEDRVLASFTLANIARGPFQACHLGYGIDAAHQGQGLMHEVLQAGLDFAFGQLTLHRVMANYLPHNERSARLLQRLGFEREGYARAYLKIAGRWQDHVLTACVAPP